jgi:hypothetical protein
MKYQVIKHNKTGTRQLALVDTIEQAKAYMTELGARFWAISYMGGFPIFKDAKEKQYSIQGYALPWGIVCSIPQKEAEACQTA